MNVINPYQDEMNSVFEKFAECDNCYILNESNSFDHWKTLQRMTKRFGISSVDLKSSFELDMFKKTGWIEFRIFSDISINAFAYTENNKQYLVINIGTLHLIRDSFFTLFSIPEFLPKLGNSELESNSIEIFRENLDENISAPNYWRYMPKCPIRHKCADEMSTIAVHFIYAHEAAHLVSCHSEYENKRYRENRFFEIRTIVDDVARAFDSRSLELQADEGGMRFSIMYITRLLQTESKDLFEPYSLYLIWIISIEILFKLMHPNDNFKDKEDDTHPNSFIRIMHLFELSIIDAIDLNLVENKREAVDEFDKSFKLIEEILEKNFFLSYSKGPFSENKRNLEAYRKRVVEIQENYLNDLRKERQIFIDLEYEILLEKKKNAI